MVHMLKLNGEGALAAYETLETFLPFKTFLYVSFQFHLLLFTLNFSLNFYSINILFIEYQKAHFMMLK